MCKQNGTAILGQFTSSLFGLDRPRSEAQAAEIAKQAVLSWAADPRRIRSAYGALSGATNEARRLAALPENDPHRLLATAMVARMNELATDELKKSRQFAEIINELNASLYPPRQAATA
ncbi:MAG: hypothetical protein PHO91_02215 [Patescibacteria group bacterium]|nr:hypothetical protein [Patescibacteria group bacterium]